MAEKLWGGRFKKQLDNEFYLFQKSIQYDHKLAGYFQDDSVAVAGCCILPKESCANDEVFWQSQNAMSLYVFHKGKITYSKIES